MARRLIPDLEEKILEETIDIGAKVGANKISTIELAKKVGVTEPAIYNRFKTKNDLLLAAYFYVSKYFESFIRIIDLDNTTELDEFKTAWYSILDHAVSHPTYTKYFDSFRFTSGYNLAEPNKYRAYFVRITKKIMSFNAKSEDLSDADYLRIWVNWVNLTLKFAVLIIDGLLSNNQRTKELMLRLVFGEQVEL